MISYVENFINARELERLDKIHEMSIYFAKAFGPGDAYYDGKYNGKLDESYIYIHNGNIVFVYQLRLLNEWKNKLGIEELKKRIQMCELNEAIMSEFEIEFDQHRVCYSQNQLDVSTNKYPTEPIDEAMNILARTFKSKGLIAYNFYFDCKKMTDKGAIALAQILSLNLPVHSVQLNHNLISDEGAIAIAEALKINQTIKYLYLHNNSITDAGIIAIAAALKTHKSLWRSMVGGGWHRTLVIGNKVTEKGESALIEALKNNKELNEAELNGNDISEAIFKRVNYLEDEIKHKISDIGKGNLLAFISFQCQEQEKGL